LESNKTNTQAIGIFDSGIGGLTVAHQINTLLPNEKILYFGDTKHVPYGEKSSDAIVQFSERISYFLLEQKCKMIVVACNTASALAFTQVENIVRNKAICINVIDPTVEFTCRSRAKSVGIIGTKNTILSNIYAKKIRLLNSELETKSLPSPLLVPMIEEGFYQNNISKTIISNYLKRKELANIDHLILGCTHYPLIEDEINQFYGNKVQVINSGKIVSKHIESILIRSKLLNSSLSNPKHEFYVSDFTDSFEKSAEYFFGKHLHLKEISL
jgi:glutamate racemase